MLRPGKCRRVVISFSSDFAICAGWATVDKFAALRQVAEHVRLDLMKPGNGGRLRAPDALCERDELLADKDAKKTDEAMTGGAGERTFSRL